MHDDAREYLAFLQRCALRLAVFALWCAPLMVMYVRQLRSAGELLTGRDLALLSARNPILWLSGYVDAGYFVKIAVATEVRPKVAAVGSSRVLQFRAEMFNRLPPSAFYNVGGAAYSMQDARECIDQLSATDEKPELVILGLDWWWFQTRHSRVRKLRDELEQYGGHEVSAWTKVIKSKFSVAIDQLQLLQKAWKDPRLHGVLRFGLPTDDTTSRLLVGIGAARGNGFRNDGSFRYGDEIRNPPPMAARRAEGFERFSQGRYRGNAIKPGSLLDLDLTLALCRERGIHVIVFLPPVDKTVLDEFRNSTEAAQFWKDFPVAINDVCTRYRVPLRDYSDPDSIAAPCEEFVDWFHGADTIYARLLANMAACPSTSRILDEYIDLHALQRDIANAVSPLDLYGH